MREIFLDSDGLPVMKNGDGGDKCARSFQIVTGLLLCKRLGLPKPPGPWADFDASGLYYTAKARLIRSDGVCYRDWKPGRGGEPYHRPDDPEWGTSRDQTMPAVIAAGLMGDPETSDIIWSAVKRNWFRFPNGKDIVTPDAWAAFSRAGQWNSKRFLLEMADYFSHWGGYIRCIQAAGDPDDVGDDILHVQYLALFEFMNPTEEGELARRYYAKTRPCFTFLGGDSDDKKNYIQVTGNGARFAYKHYFREEDRKDGTIPNPIDELFNPYLGTLVV